MAGPGKMLPPTTNILDTSAMNSSVAPEGGVQGAKSADEKYKWSPSLDC
jgi:hypothetical protein